jgi:hypothetical protein
MEFQVLRLNPNDAERKEPIGISNGRGALDDDMGIQLAVIANRHLIANTAERTNRNSCADSRPGRNNGCGMNHR